MKNTIAILGLLTLGFAHSDAQACLSAIDHRDLYLVNMPGEKLLEALTEDRIVISMSSPVVPAYMSAVTTAKYDTKVLRLVSKVQPYGQTQPVGASTDEYTFEVVGDGNTTLVLETRSKEGKVLRRISQEVEALLRSIPRCW